MFGIDTDPDPDWHALDADPDSAKWLEFDPIRIHNTAWTCSVVSLVTVLVSWWLLLLLFWFLS